VNIVKYDKSIRWMPWY